MIAKDIMSTSIKKIKSTATIKEAIQSCVNNKVSGLIVTDEKDKICGILSEKDLLVAFDFLNETDTCIDEFISKDITSVNEDTSIEDVSRLLVSKNYKRVPVIKSDEVVGIVTRGDILRWLDQEKNGDS